MPKRLYTILTSLIAGVLFAAACAAAAAGPGSPEAAERVVARRVATTTTTTVDPTAFGRWIEAASRTTTTTTTTTVAPAPRTVASTSSGCAYAAQIRAAFPGDGDWAISVAWRESRCQPGAVNWGESCGSGSHAHGLFQMCFPMHLPTFRAVGCTDPLNAECNIRAAAHLYAGSGRSPWRMG